MRLKFPVFQKPPTTHSLIVVTISGITLFVTMGFFCAMVAEYTPWVFLLAGPGAILWGFYRGFWRIER